MAALPDGELGLAEVVARFEREGYRGQFGARPGGRLLCFTCRGEQAPGEAAMRALARFEEASSPDGEAAVAAVRCGRCGAAGTLVVAYGPEAPAEDAVVLRGLRDERRGPGVSAA